MYLTLVGGRVPFVMLYLVGRDYSRQVRQKASGKGALAKDLSDFYLQTCTVKHLPHRWTRWSAWRILTLMSRCR